MDALRDLVKKRKDKGPEKPSEPTSKYRRRGEVLAEKQAAPKKGNHATAAAAGGAQIPSDGRTLKTPPPGDAGAGGAAAAAVVAALQPKEVMKRLRAMAQPITLFGENDEERESRMRKCELDPSKRDTNDVQEGQHNVFQEIFKEEADGGQGGGKAGKGEADPIDVAYDKLKAISEHTSADNEHDSTLWFFERLLIMWEIELLEKSDAWKRAFEGRQERAIQKQCAVYIEPLFKQLRNKTVPSDILQCLSTMLSFMSEGEYVRANDLYIQVAIGNAAWPLGVTMVGIHERSGRSKISSNKVAHVLNDETQRKYIQSVKRLMSFCQHKYPAAPSKSVGWGGSNSNNHA